MNDQKGQPGDLSGREVKWSAFLSTGIAMRSSEAKSPKEYSMKRKVSKIDYDKFNCYSFPGGDIVVDMENPSKPELKVFKHNE